MLVFGKVSDMHVSSREVFFCKEMQGRTGIWTGRNKLVEFINTALFNHGLRSISINMDM